MLSYIIAKGGDSEDELRAMAESRQTNWQVSPNQRLASPRSRQFTGDQPDQVEFEDMLAGEATDPFGDTLANSVYKTPTYKTQDLRNIEIGVLYCIPKCTRSRL